MQPPCNPMKSTYCKMRENANTGKHVQASCKQHDIKMVTIFYRTQASACKRKQQSENTNKCKQLLTKRKSNCPNQSQRQTSEEEGFGGRCPPRCNALGGGSPRDCSPAGKRWVLNSIDGRTQQKQLATKHLQEHWNRLIEESKQTNKQPST